MKKLLVLCLLGGRALAEPVVAIAPPSAATPQLAEAALLMQAEASRWLVATHRQELHVNRQHI